MNQSSDNNAKKSMMMSIFVMFGVKIVAVRTLIQTKLL